MSRKEFIRDIMYDRSQGWGVGLIKKIFWIFSKIFKGLLFLRTLFFRLGLKKSYRLSKPVISVGNLTVGGVGKTPMVIYLAEQIKAMGKRPAILTRGYMQQRGSGSDEAQMMLHKLKDVPVIVGADRYYEATQFLMDDTCDIFILDDGFQHRRLQRDLDIVLMDATNPWGNGQLIPRGILREPLTALERADVIVLTRTDQARAQVEAIQRTVHNICPDKLYLESVHAPKGLFDIRTKERWDVEKIKGKSVYALSSIAHPVAFERTLMSLGAHIDGASHFLDHHVYGKANIEQLLSDIRFQKVDCVLTTEKDEPKLERWVRKVTDVPFYSLRIEITLQSGKEELLGRVAGLLDR